MKKPVLNTIILIDRTGSMTNKWKQTIDAVNNTINSTKRYEDVDTKFTVLAFDRSSTFTSAYRTSTGFSPNNNIFLVLNDASEDDSSIVTTLRRYQSGRTIKNIGYNEVYPRGMTPLYDAVSEAIGLAEKDGHDKTAIIVITDGLENSSTKYETPDQIKSRIKSAEARGWDVSFIGAEFESEQMSREFGLGADKFFDVRNADDMVGATTVTSAGLHAYATRGDSLSYSADTKEMYWKGNS